MKACADGQRNVYNFKSEFWLFVTLGALVGIRKRGLHEKDCQFELILGFNLTKGEIKQT